MTDALFLFDPQVDDVPVNSDELHAGWKLTLPAHIKRHAVQAMRLKAGDNLQLSDGNGLRIQAVMADPEAGLAEVVEVGREPEPLTRLALIQALAKTGHDEQAIDMATQIGVDQVVPWQSRRAFKPQLEACASSKEVVAICRRACVHGDVVIVLHQDATDTWSGVEEKVAQLVERTLQDGRPRTVSVVVGPEGGISEQEVADFVKAGAVSCVLGRNILRAATAGPVALSLLSRVLGRYE